MLKGERGEKGSCGGKEWRRGVGMQDEEEAEGVRKEQRERQTKARGRELKACCFSPCRTHVVTTLEGS